MLLSACMIVKNEEDRLVNCFSSIRSVIDELCIVDTGSTDDTLKIIESFKLMNPKISVKIKQEEWTEVNFSKYRNISIEMATGKWILIIDADEELTFEMPRHGFIDFLKKVDQENEFSSIGVVLRDWQGGTNTMSCALARIFRPQIRYKNPIHNQPYYPDGTSFDKKMALLGSLYIDHYGYDLSEKKMEEKFERTVGALKKLIGDPEYLHTEFYLCQSYGTRGLMDESLEWGEKYINKGLDKKDINNGIYYTLGKIYYNRNEMDKASQMVIDGLEYNSNDIDLLMLKSDMALKENKIFEASLGARDFVSSYRHLKQYGLTNKFYFSYTEDALGVMLQRMAIGFLAASLESATMMLLNKGTSNIAIEEYQKQLSKWNLNCIWDAINEKLKSSQRPPQVAS